MPIRTRRLLPRGASPIGPATPGGFGANDDAGDDALEKCLRWDWESGPYPDQEEYSRVIKAADDALEKVLRWDLESGPYPDQEEYSRVIKDYSKSVWIQRRKCASRVGCPAPPVPSYLLDSNLKVIRNAAMHGVFIILDPMSLALTAMMHQQHHI